MSNEKPPRLKLPQALASSAKNVLADGFVIPDTTPIIRFAPIVQWRQMRLRLRITGAAGVVGFEFARPHREIAPGSPPAAFVYTAAQPAIDATAWVDGVELSLDVSAAEHHGENWVKITLTAAAACVVDFIDIMGDLHGQSTR
jgi:hypothetical protein